MDSPFALTSISQAQFWRRELNDYGDGTVKESFSTIISDWVTPGVPGHEKIPIGGHEIPHHEPEVGGRVSA